MADPLREFLARWLGAVLSALAPVVLVAFVTMPWSLGHHPGVAPPPADGPVAHMT